MKTGLLLETSSDKGLIALIKNDRPISFHFLEGGPALSKSLALETKKLLENTRPDFIAVGTGPGSYTGIRVGAALAQSLAFGWQIPLFGYCSLYAFTLKTEQPHTVVVDARMGGFYVLRSSSMRPLLIPLHNAANTLQDASLFASPHPALIQKRLSLPGKWVKTVPDPDLLAPLAYRLFLKGDLAPLNLDYLATPC
ncbi:MAG: tRNA (adenosine(37)-N6)-threonylcarbamoyltransferase complex dimerization subunit type 1 TsaB [Chlamydiia bacterium]|nr:tRNA (adenosine(37)-N6)-threonylcarbamoyltransferase complex dimerization subunit type 1 TsaB [Chlamydiia bacterium]